MSVATEISRIQTNRNTIRTKLVELGMASNTANLDALADAIEGIVNRGAVSVEILEGTTYTIPAGYHDGSGTVRAMTDTTGESEKYKTQTKTVTPTKSKQNISPDTGYYALESVTVNAIPENYQDVSSVTAAAGDVLTGKVYVTASGDVITGNMVNNGAVSKALDVTTITYTIPKGYHSGSGKVTITLETKTVTPTKATQEITPASGKVLSKVTVNPIPDAYQDVTGVTATADKVLEGSKFVDADGNVVDGTMDDHSNMTNISLYPNYDSYSIPRGYHSGDYKVKALSCKSMAIPSKETQVIVGSVSGDSVSEQDDMLVTPFLSEVTVYPIPDEYQDISNVTAEGNHVLKGKVFVNAYGEQTGVMENNGAITASLNASTTSYTVPEGYHNGSGKVSITTETKSATPTKSAQTITPTSGKVLSKVTVAAIPAAYQDVTGVTATAATVLTGSNFVDKNGTTVGGTMANNGDVGAGIDGLTKTFVTIPAGYTTGGTVGLTSDIEDALAAI